MQMLRRSFDVDRINAILNDPVVRPDVADLGEGILDVASSINDANNIFLLGEHGGCLFFRILPGIYEVHTVATALGRGRWVADFVLEAADWMFTCTDAFEVTTRIPIEHKGAKHLAEHAGMQFEFRRPGGCKWRGRTMDVDIYSCRIQDWIKRSNTFEPKGQAFHDFMHGEAHRLGVKMPPHADDPAHNNYVGAALEMALNGQVVKGVNWFNRAAIAGRFNTISLLSASPLTIKMDLGILRVEDGAMRIELPC